MRISPTFYQGMDELYIYKDIILYIYNMNVMVEYDSMVTNHGDHDGNLLVTIKHGGSSVPSTQLSGYQ